jgi:hypothetical protein
MFEITRNVRLLNLNFSMNWYKNYFNKFFVKTFWKYFKSFIVRDVGILTNNIHKSLIFSNIYIINNKLWNKKISINFSSHVHVINRFYVKPISIFSFSFNTQTYNTIIFLIFNLITSNYYSFKNDFRLLYGFIFHQEHFKLFYFCNINYFKVFNY